MPLTASGLLEVETMLLNLDTTNKRRCVRQLVKKGHQIKDLAIRMAPIDRGNLEEAIKMEPESYERQRDAAGRFVRTQVYIYVDTDMPIPERPGKTIGDYAYEMHEHLTPLGPLNLGPLSEEKQANNGGVQVGGGFLTRALEEVGAQIIEDIAAGMRQDLD